MGLLTELLKQKNKYYRNANIKSKTMNTSSTDIFHSDIYTSIFEHHPDAIFTLDREGHFLSCNHKVENFIGYKPNEMKGTFHSYIKKQYLEKATNHFQLTLKGKPQSYECKVKHKNGSSVRVHITNIPLKVNGEIIGVYGFAKDLTSLEQKEASLIKMENSLHLAHEVAKIASWDYDVENDYVYLSDPLYSMLGIDSIEGIETTYQNLLKMIVQEDRVIFDYHFQRTKTTGERMELKYRIIRPDQSIISVHERAEGIKDHTGKVIRIIGVLRDITDNVLTESRLKESEEKFETIANNIDVGIWSYDIASRKLLYVSPGIEKMTGFNLSDLLAGAKVWTDIIHPNDLENFNLKLTVLLQGKNIQHQYRIVDANGDEKWIEDKTFPILNSDGKLIRVDGIVQDISERKTLEEKMNHYAYHDYLTELPNRRMFVEILEQSISAEKKFSLMYVDLDRFKFVNDTLGHLIGDELLRELSMKLSSYLNRQHSLFRIGGDEFAIILTDIVDSTETIEYGRELIKMIEAPINIQGYDIHITASIGISIYPEDGETIKELKMNTNIALHRAKELGKNTVQLYTRSLNIESYKLFALENDLRKAISNEEFVLHYQPRVDTVTGKMAGAEALIRWIHPSWGMVSPVEFIPLAEESGLINEMSEWVIQEVCKQLCKWKKKGYSLVPISINLSAKTLMRADLVPTILKYLQQYGLKPELLEIEITESALLQMETPVLATIEMLKEIGIAISLDDFGTGYSSISYLKKFKVDFLKIDRSFIKTMLENPEDAMIVESIILLAKGFNLKVVAEGVETKEQWEILKKLNCHFLQGYLFSKPLALEPFTKIISTNHKVMVPIKNELPAIVEKPFTSGLKELPRHLPSLMTITRIKDQPIKMGRTKVSIHNMNKDGFCFSTSLHLPVTNEMTLQFEIEELDKIITGHIISKDEVHSNQFDYCLKFF